jgi:hypothetical protein
MTKANIAAAVQRVESVLRRRPTSGLHDDAPATARWQSNLRVVSHHANGTQVLTDMPTELGGARILLGDAHLAVRRDRRDRTHGAGGVGNQPF